MKLLCDYLGCDSNGNAGEMKFNVLLKIHQEGNKAFAALIKNHLKQYEEVEKTTTNVLNIMFEMSKIQKEFFKKKNA
jgi:hypothetical protein